MLYNRYVIDRPYRLVCSHRLNFVVSDCPNCPVISISGKNYTGTGDHNVHTTNYGYQRRVICYKPPGTEKVKLYFTCSGLNGNNATLSRYTNFLHFDWESIKQCECTAALSKTRVRFNNDCK